MDADLLRKLLSAANEFDTGRVTMDGDNITIQGDDSPEYSATTETVDEVIVQIRKDRQMEG